MKKQIAFAALGLCLINQVIAAGSATNSPAEFPVAIQVHAGQPKGDLTPIWRFFGADEADYAYMPDGKKLLGELGQLGGPQVYFRAHHLLTSGDGAYALKWSSTSAYKEDANGNPVYDWTINDKIFDTYIERGVKPYVEIGFMPEALSTHPQDYPHNPPVKERAPAKRRPGLSAEGLREVGRTGLSVDETLRRKIRRGRGEQMVLGSLERAEHQLLARHDGGLLQALRLRD